MKQHEISTKNNNTIAIPTKMYDVLFKTCLECKDIEFANELFLKSQCQSQSLQSQSNNNNCLSLIALDSYVKLLRLNSEWSKARKVTDIIKQQQFGFFREPEETRG